MENRHHGLEGGLAGPRVSVEWDAAAVVAYRYATVLTDMDPDVVAEAGHRLVDAVVHDLDDEVVEAALVGAADIHAWAAAYCLQAFEDLDVAGGILLFG